MLHNDGGMGSESVVAPFEKIVIICFCLNIFIIVSCLQTEDPAMERPYTFKDFLLRPRRLVFTEVVTQIFATQANE